MGGSTWVEECKPVLAMVVTQFIYAGNAISSKAAFNQGLSPMVFVVYRQAIATLFLAPFTIIAKGSLRHLGLGMRGFGLVFGASLVGATVNQYLYYQGLNLASSSMASATNNLVPAITFLMAISIGLEKIKLGSTRSMAKVLGTIICVGGAIFMAFFKGPTLLNMNLQKIILLLSSASEDWILGSAFLIASTCCGSFWLISQVPIGKHYLDPLSLSTWMCLLSTFQSAIITFFVEPNLDKWKITSLIELFACLFTGILGSGVTAFLQSWSVSVRGPFFSAMFTPLSTIITTIFAVIVLNEKLYAGSLIGALAVVSGLYIVLWGKAKHYTPNIKSDPKERTEQVIISIDKKRSDTDTDLMKPLITEKLEDVESALTTGFSNLESNA